MQDYRDEIKDFFAVDKQLAAELEYDMKKYNEQLAQEQALTAHADVSRVAEGGDRTQPVQVREAATVHQLSRLLLAVSFSLHASKICNQRLELRSRACSLLASLLHVIDTPVAQV